MKNIKRKTTLIVLGIIVVISTIHAGASIYWSRRSLAEEQREHRRLFERSYTLIANRLDTYLSKRLNGLLVQPEILQAFRDRDRKKLYDLTKDKFQVIKRELPGYPILHFHTPDHKSFLRVHKPERYDDNLEEIRPMIQRVIHSRVAEKGYEVGKFAILYRVARPIFYDGEFLGVLEIGGDVGYLLNELHQLYALPSAFYVTESSLEPYKEKGNFRRVSGRLMFSSNDDLLFGKVKDVDFVNGGKTEIEGKDYAILVSDPIYDFKGDLIGNIVSLHDLSRSDALQENIIVQTVIMSVFLLLLMSLVLERSFGRMVADLEESNTRAIKAEKAKGEFLANMSHEIRTPMNVIIGMTELVLDTPLNDRQKYLLGSVKTASDSLLGLLNDILDFSKIEAGQLQLDMHVFSIASLVSSVRSIMEVAAEDKGIQLLVQADFDQLPVYVEGDELRLRQVLVNLLNNAIKFTNEGSTVIKVEREASDDAGIALLRFSVIDTGVGIAFEQQGGVFTSFRQADSSTARKFGGTGLGLAISKQLVEMMGGQLWFESEPGKGSSFYFNVPLAISEGKRSDLSEQSVVATAASQLRILLVEDNMANRDLAKMVLEQAGHSVVTAHDGLNALEVIADDDFDVVLMDVQMPVMDGHTACGIIRDCEKGRAVREDIPSDMAEKLMKRLAGGHLSIIAMTANAMQGDKEKSLQAGMDFYLTKPFLPGQVALALQSVSGSVGIKPS